MIENLIARGRELIAEALSRDDESSKIVRSFWEAFGVTLDAVEKRAPLLEALGREGLEKFLRQITADAPAAARLRLIAGADSPDELIAWARVAATELEEDTGERRRKRQELIALAIDIGKTGGGILLRLLPLLIAV
jgi:hypothetical protein